MALLDVGDVIDDPDFTTLFDVVRQAATVDAHGRAQVASTTFPNVSGFLLVVPPNDVSREDDAQRTPRNIDVVSRFRFRASGVGILPDRIIWQGTTFEVKDVTPHVNWGTGFVKVHAESIANANPPLG